jgi:hypothetical protein
MIQYFLYVKADNRTIGPWDSMTGLYIQVMTHRPGWVEGVDFEVKPEPTF